MAAGDVVDPSRPRRNRSPRRGVVPVSFPALVEPADELTIDEVRRYSRHLIIPDVGHDRAEAAQERQGAGHRRRRPRLARAALPRRRRASARSGIAEFDEVDESNLQRQIIHGQSDIGKSKASLRQGVDRRDQPAGQRGRARRAPRQRQRARDLRGLRPDRRRHRQLRDPLHGQRRGVLPEEAVRLGLDLPLRRPGVGVRADARRRTRPATAASTPSRRRRAWCRPAPRAACWACSARASARSRSTRRSSCSPASATRWSAG